jgi:hypothetical protein
LPSCRTPSRAAIELAVRLLTAAEAKTLPQIEEDDLE